MPGFVRRALSEHRAMLAFRARPAYQQNDYIGWIVRAKLDATRRRRLTQMIDELLRGGVYMKMQWRA